MLEKRSNQLWSGSIWPEAGSIQEQGILKTSAKKASQASLTLQKKMFKDKEHLKTYGWVYFIQPQSQLLTLVP